MFKRLLVGLFFLAVLLAAGFAYHVYHQMMQFQPKADVYQATPYPAVNYGSGAQAELIKKGEYLTKAGDCIACHTRPNGGKPFAGGREINTPFGKMYSPNITPDKKTGIGNWTDEQFIHAMREGISPEGHFYYPALPYLYFNKVSKDDLIAIHAYLHALPAVEEANRENEMIFPFNLRFLQSGWRLLFFDFNRGEYKADPRKPADWNRGAYLVQGLAHCAMCHTPMYYLLNDNLVLGAPIKKYNLAGGFVDGYASPNISARRLADVPNEKIVNVFLKDEKINGGTVQGPMWEVNHDSLKYLSKDDLDAIATYIKSVQSDLPPPPKLASGSGAGKAVYDKYCAACHAMGSGGAPKFGDPAAWSGPISLGMDALYKNAINGIGGMPAKGNCMSCTDQNIKDAVDYMVAAAGKSTAGASSAKTPYVPDTSLARGKQVYTQVCSICHDKGELGAPIIGDKQTWAPLIAKNMDILVYNSIHGYKGHPPKGACYQCTSADIIAAVKYMVQQSRTEGDYTLW